MDKYVTTIWLAGSGRKSPTLHLPIEIAKRYSMHKPCYIELNCLPQGILIKYYDSKPE